MNQVGVSDSFLFCRVYGMNIYSGSDSTATLTVDYKLPICCSLEDHTVQYIRAAT